MMDDMIQKLKHNQLPFGLLTENERRLLTDIKEANCVMFTAFGWGSFGVKFEWTQTYRIKLSYHPEPKEQEKVMPICPNCKRGGFAITMNMLRGSKKFSSFVIECECGLKTTFDWSNIKETKCQEVQ